MASKKSYILAGMVATGVTAWMLSDNIVESVPAPKPAASATTDVATEASQFIVSAVRVENEQIIEFMV